MVRKSFIAPRSTLRQIEKDTPHVYASMQRWFDELGKNGDGRTKAWLKRSCHLLSEFTHPHMRVWSQEFLRELRQNDAADIKSKAVHARPLMRLMMHEHAKALKFILGRLGFLLQTRIPKPHARVPRKACKGSKKAWEKFTRWGPGTFLAAQSGTRECKRGGDPKGAFLAARRGAKSADQV